MKTFLFFFFLLGTVSSQDSIDYSRPSDPNDWSTGVVKDFLWRMEKAIGEKNEENISALFLNEFVYTGCKVVYDRNEVIRMLMEFPSSSQLDIELIYSKWINYNVDIDYIVIIRGFGDEEFKAEFTLTRDNIGSFWRLSSGKTPEICDQLSSEQVVNSFVKLMKGVILGRNEQLIGDLFLDSFVFYGCKTNYQKAEAIQLLLSLPATMRFTISSSQLISDSQITFTVKIGEIGSNEIISEVHLYRDSMIMSHWKLSSGAVKNCGQVSEKRSVEDSDYGFGPYF